MAFDLYQPIENLKHVGPRNLPRLKHLGIKTINDLIRHFPTRYENYSELVPISDIKAGEKVHVQGQVVKISARRIFPRRLTIIEAIVQDDSGAVRAVWFNQPYILNSLPEGTLVSLAGKATLSKKGLQLSSPTYEKFKRPRPDIASPLRTRALSSSLRLSGPGKRDGDSTEGNIGTGTLTHTHGLVPIYPETEGVTSKYLRFLIKPLIERLEIKDPLPEAIRTKYNFPTLEKALKSIHYPQTQAEAEIAKKRLAFDDLLLFQIKALLERRKLNQLKSVIVPFEVEIIKDFISHLPFKLTGDQKIAAWEIFKDLEKPYPMNRLLEGDVGSGKTVVALMAAYMAAHHGCQSVFMAPTEVLANQHMETIRNLVGHNNIEICLLTGSTAWSTYSLQSSRSPAPFRNGDPAGRGSPLRSGKRQDIKKRIASGEVKIVIGTQALIQKGVEFNNLALAVVDEQHRFGVAQRAALVKNKALVPHLLSMTATPIPRTLALTIYGDLDISILKEKPENRQKIITKIITPSKREEAYDFIRQQVRQGRQVFVICPRIELPSPDIASPLRPRALSPRDGGTMSMLLNAQATSGAGRSDVKAVEEEHQKLSAKIFPDLRVAMLHGRMKAKEKNEIMDKFKKHQTDILVSTSVIEVGVDVPNATVMMIENAERFGLAQLHQFRGRIGRDQHRSYCFLFSSTAEKRINQRLKAVAETDDGFLLAEKDMAIRGPGEFLGAKQSGLPDLAMASLADVDLIKKARTEARTILKEDPDLKKYPLLSERLGQFEKMVHFE